MDTMNVTGPAFCAIRQPAIAAHRGAARRYPENSLAAFKEAVNIAMEYPEAPFLLEMDVRATMDGIPVIMHDPDVSRTTGGVGEVETLPFDVVGNLRMKPLSALLPPGMADPQRSAHPFFPVTEDDLRVPAVPEVIELVRRANQVRSRLSSPIGIAFEIKPQGLWHHQREQIGREMGVGIASMLDHAGMHRLAEHVLPLNPTVPVFAKLLNDCAARGDLDFPFIIFSAEGPIGRRDMNELWIRMSSEAQAATSGMDHRAMLAHGDDFSRLAEHAPHRMAEVMDNQNTLLQKLEQFKGGFWLIGTIPGAGGERQEIRSCIMPIDTPEAVRQAVEQGATLLTTNDPVAVAEELRRLMPPECRMAQFGQMATNPGTWLPDGAQEYPEKFPGFRDFPVLG